MKEVAVQKNVMGDVTKCFEFKSEVAVQWGDSNSGSSVYVRMRFACPEAWRSLNWFYNTLQVL